jgi:hypothetical protein
MAQEGKRRFNNNQQQKHNKVLGHYSFAITMAPSSFPVEARVILQGLVKAADLNGEKAVVKSQLINGRQHVHIVDVDKSVALKPSNLRYESRTVESLSVKELKAILKQNNGADSDITGIDKGELKAKVSDLQFEEEQIAEILARANAPKNPPTSSAQSSYINPSAAANQLANMSPDQLRQQARAMRSMDPNTLRRMNPQFANLTNDQIIMAANQMEMMANNPHMMKAAADQVKNMQPQELERMQKEMVNDNIDASIGISAPAPATSSATPTQSQFEKASNMMANMTPEQLRQQANMMKTMEPDTIRRMNPQLAHMTDEQIKASSSQFEMMANNPELMKMAMNQMKHMSPEQVEAIKNGGTPPPNMDKMGGADPASMLANMDTKQLKQMLQQVKGSPEMMKQFAKMSGISEEQLSKGVESFASMDDASLDKAVKVMKNAQRAKDVWTNANVKTGGHLLKIIIGGTFVIIALLVNKIWFSSGGVGESVPVIEEFIPNVETVADDEFASEF